jgi:hypothetical protein
LAKYIPRAANGFAKHWQILEIARRMPRVRNSSLFSRHSSLRGGGRRRAILAKGTRVA